MEKKTSFATTAKKTFATAINCMDGRVQEPVACYMKKKFNVDYVDAITESGPNKILAEQTDFARVSTLKERYMISINHHHSANVCVAGHHGCVGNPVEKGLQLEQIGRAMRTVRSWNSEINVIGLWVDEHGQVHEVGGA